MSVLFVLVGWKRDRRLGIALTLFATVIQIGSFHLGWHYAIDGYAGAALAFILWVAVSRGLKSGSGPVADHRQQNVFHPRDSREKIVASG